MRKILENFCLALSWSALPTLAVLAGSANVPGEQLVGGSHLVLGIMISSFVTGIGFILLSFVREAEK